jgi:hypothetical protein
MACSGQDHPHANDKPGIVMPKRLPTSASPQTVCCNDPRGWEISARAFKATGRSPDSQAGVDPPERAAFPNRRHDIETSHLIDPVAGRPEGTALARLRLLTVAGAVRALRQRSSNAHPVPV